jgi:HemK-like putative methylase
MEMDWLLRDKYGGRMTPAAKRDIARLGRGEHVNYVIGWSPFLGCRVDLSARPLIPRPETEYWTEQALRAIKKLRRARVLDLFCGSGCIGIAVLKHVPKAQVDFADIEKKYFAGVRKSFRANKIDARRARFIRSDVFKDLPKRGAKYDYILANPPYIPTVGRAVAKLVLAQEPCRALFAGKDGLQYIRKILRTARTHLLPGGTMFIEFDPPQRAAIAALARKSGWESEFFKDQYGRWRFAQLR